MKQLGFRNYTEYINSQLWKGIRKKAFSIHGQRCNCGQKATQVHHLDYSMQTLRGEIRAIEEFLRPICKDCHFKEHPNRLKKIGKQTRKTKLLADMNRDKRLNDISAKRNSNAFA